MKIHAMSQYKSLNTFSLVGYKSLKINNVIKKEFKKNKIENIDRKIKQCIYNLSNIDTPFIGLSGTLSGDSFAPLPGHRKSRVLKLEKMRLVPTEDFKFLVANGLESLPFLIDELDNPTLTKLAINVSTSETMWHDTEFPYNPVNPAERLISLSKEIILNKTYISSYKVTIGDVCFVAIGQIIGRPYQAVHYKPTSCIVVNSPVKDLELCSAIRSIWSKFSVDKFYKFLINDYSTIKTFEKSYDEWDAVNELVCSSAMRLLYYFPEESIPFLLEKLKSLKIGTDKNIENYIRRVIINGGIRSESFIEALNWSKDPKIRAALTQIFRNSNNDQILQAALPGVDDMALVRYRLESRIAALHRNNDEDGLYGQGYHYLRTLALRTPESSYKVFQNYLQKARVQRCLTVCLVLREIRVTWDKKLLLFLLKDTRSTGYNYLVAPNTKTESMSVRVCDEAAITLNINHPELRFVQYGDHKILDAQISVLKKRLSSK